MEDCCLAVVAKYEALMGVREGAALYCKVCHSRIVYHEGVWGTEGA